MLHFLLFLKSKVKMEVHFPLLYSVQTRHPNFKFCQPLLSSEIYQKSNIAFSFTQLFPGALCLYPVVSISNFNLYQSFIMDVWLFATFIWSKIDVIIHLSHGFFAIIKGICRTFHILSIKWWNPTYLFLFSCFMFDLVTKATAPSLKVSKLF